MKLSPTPLIVIVLMLAAAALPMRAVASEPGGLDHRPVCGPTPARFARCNAEVVTDAQGNPLVQINPDMSWFGPAQLHGAYALPCTPGGPAPQTSCGTSAFTYSGGQIVAVVDAYNDPTIAKDLGMYSTQYGIPPCPQGSLSDSTKCLTVVNQKGGTRLPATNALWSEEISLDVETVHQLCQTCKILLVEGNSASITDLASATIEAANLGAKETSNSYGSLEFSGENLFDYSYNHPGVAVVASAGDHGYGTQYPASSPDTVAVGGTLLGVNSLTNNTYTWASESVWGRLSQPPPPATPVPEGTGSGCSAIEPANTWQTSTGNWAATGCGSFRGVADVAADADPNSGVAIYASTNTSGTAGWLKEGGTSLAAPIIASVFALAGGVRANTQAQQIPYLEFTNLNSHDVTSGSNGPNTNGATCSAVVMCNGETGYDGPTGVGTPNGVAGFQLPGQ
jgi:subtilase family serine protease